MRTALLQSKLHLQAGYAILIDHTLIYTEQIFTSIYKVHGLKYL